MWYFTANVNTWAILESYIICRPVVQQDIAQNLIHVECKVGMDIRHCKVTSNQRYIWKIREFHKLWRSVMEAISTFSDPFGCVTVNLVVAVSNNGTTSGLLKQTSLKVSRSFKASSPEGWRTTFFASCVRACLIQGNAILHMKSPTILWAWTRRIFRIQNDARVSVAKGLLCTFHVL